MIETSVTFGSSHSFPRVMDRRSKIVASVIATYWYLRHHISCCWIIVAAIINIARARFRLFATFILEKFRGYRPSFANIPCDLKRIKIFIHTEIFCGIFFIKVQLFLDYLHIV